MLTLVGEIGLHKYAAFHSLTEKKKVWRDLVLSICVQFLCLR